MKKYSEKTISHAESAAIDGTLAELFSSKGPPPPAQWEGGGLRYAFKQVIAGDLLDFSIYPANVRDTSASTKSEPKTPEENRRHNYVAAHRKLTELFHANFRDGDFFVTATFSDGYLPADWKGVMHEVVLFVRRLRNAYKKRGLGAPRYVYIVERGQQGGRLHIHLIITGGLESDDLIALWAKKGKSMGRVNCDRLQTREDGFEGLARYFLKTAFTRVKGARAWNSSKNLVKPTVTVEERRLSNRQVHDLADELNSDSKAYLRANFPGYRVVGEPSIRWSDIRPGACIFIRLLREPAPRQGRSKPPAAVSKKAIVPPPRVGQGQRLRI